MVSLIKFFFIFRSRGVSVEKLGVWLTSSSQGFSSESIRMSILYELCVLPEHLESHGIGEVVWLAGVVGVREHGLD